jgi:dihydroorotate dehydrogenase
MFYKNVVKPVLFKIDPEWVHRRILPLGRLAGSTLPTRSVLSATYGYHSNDAEVTVDGVRYHTPVVLSAGFDPNGELVETLSSIGFGGEEVGSVSARPCTGNPAPNQTRLPHTKSLIVNKGLRNKGVVAVTEHLKHTRHIPGFAVGVSIARTNDTEACELDAGIDD